MKTLEENFWSTATMADYNSNSSNIVIKLQYNNAYNSVDSPAPTILQSGVQIPCMTSTLFPFIVKFCSIFVIVLRKGRK